MAAAHGEHDALQAALEAGHPLDASIAAALGDGAALEPLLASASPAQIQNAFGLAVINAHLACATIALDAGADVNAFLPVHAHSTALHHAAGTDDVATIALLLARGARTDLRDTLWNATPLAWAIDGNRAAATAALERLEPPVAPGAPERPAD